jgi:hypothetical protein
MDVHFGIPDKESEYMVLSGGERAPSFALLEWEVPRMASLNWTEPGILNALQTKDIMEKPHLLDSVKEE